MPNDESDDDGFDSRSAGTCAFSFPFDDSVGRVVNSVVSVCVVVSGIFFPTGIRLIGDVVPLVMFVPIGIESNGGQLIEIFWHTRS